MNSSRQKERNTMMLEGYRMMIYQAADFIQQDEKIALIKVSHHSHIPEHSHNFVELVYISHGSSLQRVNEQPYHVQRGDLLWMNVGDRHAFDAGDEMQYMNILIQPDFLNEQLTSFEPDKSFFSQQLFQEFQGVLQRSLHIVRFRGRPMMELEELLEKMYREYAGKQNGYRAMLRGYATLLMASAFRRMQDNLLHEATPGMHDLLPKLLSYIEQHYSSRITLRDLAKESFYSPYYLSKTFKTCFGYTFTEYVQEVRLREAKRILLESEETVESVGKSVGIPDKSQFFRLFKQFYGMTPQQYRKQTWQ